MDNIWDNAFRFNAPYCNKKIYSKDFIDYEIYTKFGDKSLKTYDWNDIIYEFNSDGFRSDEFDNNEKGLKILYVGCSFTQGVGLPHKHIWSSFLNKMISNKYNIALQQYNIGFGGASLDTICRLLYFLIKVRKFKPDLVLGLMPHYNRVELFFEGSLANNPKYPPIFMLNYPARGRDKKYDIMYKKFTDFFESEVFIEYFIRNMMFISCILEDIPFYWNTWTGELLKNESFKSQLPTLIKDNFMDIKWLSEHIIPDKYRIFDIEIARDGQHPGPNCHYYSANQYFDWLESRNIISNLLG